MKQSDLLQQLIEREAARADTHAVLLGVQSGDGSVQFRGAAGAARPQDPFLIASITKMHTAAAVLQLVDEGAIELAAPVQIYLPHLDLSGIHSHKGIDYSRQITISHLPSCIRLPGWPTTTKTAWSTTSNRTRIARTIWMMY